MLGLITSDADVGYYNAAVKIRTVLLSIVTSIGTVLLPRVSYYIEQGYLNEFRRVSKKSLHLILLMSIPLTVYFIIFAKEGINFLSGPAFEKSILPMRVIMPTLVIVGITNVTGIQILIPQGRENIVLYSEIAGAITDLCLNLFFIPKYASVGAALGTLVAEFVVLIVQFIALRKEIVFITNSIPYFKILLSVILASLVSVVIRYEFEICFYDIIKAKYELGYFLEILVFGTIFFGIYLSLLVIMKDKILLEFKDNMKNIIIDILKIRLKKDS